ncbi:hypothetical protein HORIV_07940 [Vreelandella olivaria]|uniref:Branched-chain-amino-acid transaminase n=1 Tax=Vreelandella olivaria TaxID=390919 RepID=A0ABM7GD07_9GAMM|nr:hypothetical protein HORIV_07940 [Halomonas olivaria]
MPTNFEILPSNQPIADEIRDNILKNPGFGKHFTDHMAHVRWTVDADWHGHQVRPYGPLTLDPAASVLHYGQEIFEGIKAYRHADGSIWTFRPEKNAERFRRSARRLALPELSDEDFIGSLKALLAQDQAWVPTPANASDECSLYLRPFMIASEAFLGVRPAHEVDYYVIASPRRRTLKAALPRYRSGSRLTTSVRPPAAPALPSVAATTPLHWPRRKRPKPISVVRSRSWMPLKTSGWKSWAA